MSISVIILSFNSERIIAETLRSAAEVSDDIHVVDSFSTDATLNIVQNFKAHLVQHEFENYGAQRNWAIDNLPLKYDWELHLDADERPDPVLIERLKNLKGRFPPHIHGYHIARLIYFMGRPIRYGGMFPIWHLRLFRHGRGRCENRQYDQHFYVDGATALLPGVMIDDIRMSLGEWINRHNRWSDAEVRELGQGATAGRIQGRLGGTPIQQKRFFRDIYNRLPLFVRPFLLFIYRYFFRLGFLCGKEGLIFFILQTFWFRFLIDAKLYEKWLAKDK
jgi:glycosyltransferase involved in cell wall biosynthesis